MSPPKLLLLHPGDNVLMCIAPVEEAERQMPPEEARVAIAQPPLLDSGVPLASVEEEGWGFSQRTEADLDGDGVAEGVVLMARVELYRGRPAWDDGQVWQAYVEEQSGERTHLYARFVQLGTLSLRVGLAERGGNPVVVLLEQLPDRLAVYELAYAGPGAVTTQTGYTRDLDPTGDVASPALP